MKKDVMLVTGAGQISMAIARRIGFGKKTSSAIRRSRMDAGAVGVMMGLFGAGGRMAGNIISEEKLVKSW